MSDLVDAAEAATLLGVGSAAAARRQLSRWKVPRADVDASGSRLKAVWRRADVVAAVANGRRYRRLGSPTASTATPGVHVAPWENPPCLPPLDEPCPHCTGPAADAERDANRAEWNAWHDKESAGFERFVAERRARGNINAWDPDVWTRTDEYQALGPRPELLPDAGCVECDWRGRVPTVAGRQVLAFLATHGGAR